MVTWAKTGLGPGYYLFCGKNVNLCNSRLKFFHALDYLLMYFAHQSHWNPPSSFVLMGSALCASVLHLFLSPFWQGIINCPTDGGLFLIHITAGPLFIDFFLCAKGNMCMQKARCYKYSIVVLWNKERRNNILKSTFHKSVSFLELVQGRAEASSKGPRILWNA